MVGRRTSPRCANCRQRKVKCDLARPSCSQCVKSKWPCPGYDTHSRFYAYGKDTGYPKDSGRVTPASTDSWSIPRSDVTTPSSQVSLSSRRSRNLSVFPLSAADTLRNKLVFKISVEGVAARLMVVPEAHVLKHIPVRVGTSQALDDAVNCICSDDNRQKAWRSCMDSQNVSNISYPKALQSLQRALLDEGEHVTAETMAAATLLQMHEHSTAHFEQGWITHANGVIKMLEVRGPSHMDSELDAAILHAEIGNIFIDSLRNRKVSFLTDPRWKALLRVHAPYGGDAKRNAAHNAMVAVGFFIPGIISRFEEYHYSSQGADGLILDLNRVCEPLKEWKGLYLLQRSCQQVFQDPLHPVDQNLRMSYASSISYNVFHMLMYYVAIDLDTSLGQAATNTMDLRDMFGLQSLTAVMERFEKFASEARIEFPALEAVDKLAASNTAWLMSTLLNRVVSAAEEHPSLLGLQQTMQSLSADLAAAVIKQSNVSPAVSKSFPPKLAGDD